MLLAADIDRHICVLSSAGPQLRLQATSQAYSAPFIGEFPPLGLQAQYGSVSVSDSSIRCPAADVNSVIQVAVLSHLDISAASKQHLSVDQG